MSAGMPWWASDVEEPQLDDQDPFSAHRAGRAGHAQAEPEWAQALGDVAVSVVRRLSSVSTQSPAVGRHVHAGTEAEDSVCRNCPVCSLLRAVDRSGSDISEHLGDAARHLALAAASFLEALAERPVSDEALAERPVSDEALAERPVSGERPRDSEGGP